VAVFVGVEVGVAVLVGVAVFTAVDVGVLVGVNVAVLTKMEAAAGLEQVASALATPVPGCPTR
jgi:hypothetical protein